MPAGAGAFLRERNGKFVVTVRVIGADGRRATESRTFATRPAAVEWKDAQRAAIQESRGSQRRVGEAIDAYERHLEHEGHRQAAETVRRLRSFFAGEEATPIGDLTAHSCGRIYEAVTKRKATIWKGAGDERRLVELDRPIASTTHRGMLTHSKTFLGWCVERRWLKANPLGSVKPKGELKHGKRQLRIDEARKWRDEALRQAMKEPGAVAALCALVLGLRATEIVTRQVRDLDDQGRLLWVDDIGDFTTKTAAGRRTVVVVPSIRPFLRRLAKGQQPDALLFGVDKRGRPHTRSWVLWWVKRICEDVEVPVVGSHAMRGLLSTLARLRGLEVDVIADMLGHAGTEVTRRSYIDPRASARADQSASMRVLEGRRGSTKGSTTGRAAKRARPASRR